MADLVQDLQDQAVLVLGDPLALVRVDQVVLGTMIVRRAGMTGALLVIVGRAGMTGALLVTGLRVVMTGVLLVIGFLVEILVIGLLVAMIGVLMTGPHVATEQIPAQAVLVLGDHLALVLVDLVALGTMIVRHVVILVIGLRVVMTGAQMIGLRVVMTGAQMTGLLVVILGIVLLVGMIGVLLVIVLRVVILVIVLLVAMIAVVLMIVRLVVILVIGLLAVMTGAILVTVLRVEILVIVLLVVMIAVVRMIGPHVATALVLVGRLVRAVMTVVMAGDEAVPVKKTLLPASRVMRPSAGVQQFVPEVVAPFVRI